MNSASKQMIGRSLAAVVVAALLAACDSGSVGPERRSAARLEAAATAEDGEGLRDVDLASCSDLAPQVPSRLAFHAYARGVQIYKRVGTAWTLVGPSAVLTANADGTGVVGFHYLNTTGPTGPAWQGVSGSKVVGILPAMKSCLADASAIKWLLIQAAASEGPGIFDGTTFIQRLNTAGGLAPSYAGSEGEIVEVPYTAEYFFYKAE